MANQFVKNLIVLVIATTAVTSNAALFDDKEARKKILEVEATSKANFDTNQAAINDLKKSQAAVEAVIQGQGLVDMQNQIQILKQEIANLKGELEVAVHNVNTLQQRQKDLYTDTDTRLRKIESMPAPALSGAVVNDDSLSAAAPAVEEKDVKAFTDAESLSLAGKHKEAFTAFDNFLREYPNSKLAADALYGMGYSQFALKNYKSSIVTQQKVIDLHATSVKVPDAMYSIANSQIQLGQVTSAKKTLSDLVAKHPNADVIPNAKKRLKALESLK